MICPYGRSACLGGDPVVVDILSMQETQKLCDSYGRTLDYLRVSLTEDCNFRCVYCVPPEGIRLAGNDEVLRTDELLHLARILVRLGIRRMRLTGGEPLLRQDVVSLVRELAAIQDLSEVALTTNGSRLASLARPLKEAGLATVNLSLDSLHPERFARITKRDRFSEVFEGLLKALDASLRVKINVLALSDLGREEVLEFISLAIEKPVSVRFLEFMPLCGDGWAPEWMLPIATVKRWVAEAYDLRPIPRANHVAETFELAGARGTVGFIASLSDPFCERCNRLRLTASGQLSLCLFSPIRIDLRSCLRGDDSDEDIMERIRSAVLQKPKRREPLEDSLDPRELPYIRVIGG